jgi:hypothetical protein
MSKTTSLLIWLGSISCVQNKLLFFFTQFTNSGSKRPIHHNGGWRFWRSRLGVQVVDPAAPAWATLPWHFSLFFCFFVSCFLKIGITGMQSYLIVANK